MPVVKPGMAATLAVAVEAGALEDKALAVAAEPVAVVAPLAADSVVQWEPDLRLNANEPSVVYILMGAIRGPNVFTIHALKIIYVPLLLSFFEPLASFLASSSLA